MSLTKYRQKRQFQQTPEPRGHKSGAASALRFVVQKHDASRLHYDFRLELDGVMKSWAVPKGPSLNPEDKRLAVMVEDHPLDYRTFEGTIPAGNYGAGTVMVWDNGFYSAMGAGPDRRSNEQAVQEGLDKGHLKISLQGKKLRGDFSLIRLKRGKERDWLLIKNRDEWASESDVTLSDRSVATGRDLNEIAGNGKPHAIKHVEGTPRPRAGRATDDPMPHSVKPMLATLVDRSFDRTGWYFELKWDGYRAIAEISDNNVALYSRKGTSFTGRFEPIVQSLKRLGHDAVFDGELVVVDREGRSRFQLLQNYQKTGKGQLLYYVFDLLYLDGSDLRGEPLRRRKELLKTVLGHSSNIVLSEHIERDGIRFFEAAVARGLEGIIAKDASSRYREGVRGTAWLKIKARNRQEAVIGGFTEPRGSRKDLGAVILGVYQGTDLVYIGHTGGGSRAEDLSQLRSRLEPLIRASCPFKKKPKTNAPAHWVEPKLVCEVAFQEWTDDGAMRQPIILGMREDKPPRTVRRELPVAMTPGKLEHASEESESSTEAPTSAASKRVLKKAKQSAPEHEAFLTHLDKIYWPDEKLTKGDLIAYYREFAPVILPYLRDRPLSLHRHPNGIKGKSFFQKDVSRQPPPNWVATASIPSVSHGAEIEYVLCQDARSLLFVANLGCIELNPWNSRLGSLEEPDYVVIDLDPEDIEFKKVVEAALVIRDELESAEIESCCKTSGKRGLHIFIPVVAGYTYDQATQFAQIIATLAHQRLPGSTSLVRSPSLRQGKVYLDYLQNRRGQTLAAAYSARPVAGARVSTPLLWREVNYRLRPDSFTIKTIPSRLEKVGDMWKPVLEHTNDLARALTRLREDGKT